jgi:protein-S-isoprenylcysteine O-methyltransferase Ste14
MNEKNGEHPFGDAGQLIAFFMFVIVWILDSFILRLSTSPLSVIPLYVRLPIAVLILAVSIYLFNKSHHAVPKEERSAKLITSGAFRYLRHPLYMSTILFYLAFVIPTVSIISLVLWVLIFAFYDFIAGYEEKILEEKFGEEYSSYRSKTAKWVPGVW